MKTKTLTCLNCSSIFIVPDIKRNLKRTYCGAKCAKSANGKRNKGRKHTLETCAHFSRIRFGQMNPFYGQNHSEETKAKIAIKNSKSRKIPIIINETERNILDGLMLGDGHIDSNNFCGRYTQGCKYLEFLEHIKLLLPLDWGPIWEDKKQNCYHLKSHFTPTLLEFKKRWYPSGKKIVPKDLILSKEAILYWFLGDGSIRFGNKSKFPNSKHYEIKLATDGFTREDNLFLVEQLGVIGIRSSVLKYNQIRIFTESNEKFFKLLGSCPVNCYNYKWRGYNDMNKKKALILGITGQGA